MPGECHRKSVIIQITASLRLGLWLLVFAYTSLVCAGFFLARFGDMAPVPDTGVAVTTLAYLVPLAVAFALDRCLVTLADLLCPCRS